MNRRRDERDRQKDPVERQRERACDGETKSKRHMHEVSMEEKGRGNVAEGY